MTRLAARIAEAAYALRLDDVPPAAIEATKAHLLDALGVGLAAASLPAGRGVFEATIRLGDGGTSSALGFGRRLPAPSAALLNGTLIHSLEYDDTHIASVVHGSSVVVPAALAMAEAEGASGPELLRALLLGWELLGRLGLAAPGLFQARGFQITAVGGPFAAALVGALLARADATTVAHALGIAGSQGGGIFAYLADGATVKSLHPGWAAHAGLVASLLARGGMSGPRAVFEGRFGFFEAYVGSPEHAARLAQGLDRFGRDWLLPQAAFKAYPCCHYIHPFLEALTRIMANGLKVDDVVSIDCEVPIEEAPIICEPWQAKQRPWSGYEAKFSLPYALAALLTQGAVTVDTFSGPADDAAALDLAQRISWRPMKDSGFPARFAARLAVATKDGACRVEDVPDVKGSPARPFELSEVRAKFRTNAARRLRPAAVSALETAVDELALAPDMSAISAALAGVREH